MPSESSIRRGVARLSLMKFFPGDPDSRAAISEALNQICGTDAQLDTLTQHFPKVFSEWCGVYELRACACAMFRPADGFEVDSAAYPQGVPTPKEIRTPGLNAIPPAARRLDLPPGEQVQAHRLLSASKGRNAELSTDPELDQLVREKAAEIEAMPKPRTVAEIEASRQIFGHESESTWERQQSEWFERLPKVPAGMQKSEWLRRLEWDFGLGNLEQRDAILKKLSHESKPCDFKPGPITQADFDALKRDKPRPQDPAPELYREAKS